MVRACILSGGGSYGSYQVGVLKYLAEQNREYKAFCGVSVGAINAAHLAQYTDFSTAVDDLMKMWLFLEDKDIKQHHLPFFFLTGAWKPSLYSTKPLQDMVRNRLKFNPESIRNSGNKLRVGAVSLETYEYRTFTEQDHNIDDAVLASSAFPIMFEPIEIDGQLWADGGIKNMTPLKEAIMIPEVTDIDVIMCSTPKESRKRKPRPGNILRVAQRALEAVLDEILITDIKVANLYSQLINAGVKAPNLEGKRHITINTYYPNQPLAGDGLTWNPEEVTNNIRYGYEDSVADNSNIE